MKQQQPEKTPDAVLVVAAILGNLGAFDELVLRYRAAVVRLAASIAGKTDAEDIAQDAFLRAFKALPSIQDPARFAPWLRAITRHCALRNRRQAQVQRARTVDLDAMLLDRIGPITLPPAQDDSAALHQALDELPDPYALVLRLYFLDEVPQRRIAAFLGVPTSTVKWRVYRGRQLLRNMLEHSQTPELLWNANANSPSW